MKNSLIFILNMIILFVLFSCSDQDESDSSNHIQFYGENYLLEKGAIYHDNNNTVVAISNYMFEDRYSGITGERIDHVTGFSAEVKEKQTGNFLISLYGKGFTISDLTKDARGNGTCICLRIASPDKDKIVAGEYTYSLSHDEYTFKGYSSVLYDIKKEIIPNELTAGKVQISQEGDTYTITFKCETSFGGLVEGSFTGPLKWMDIRKEYETTNFYKNIKLEALYDEINYTDGNGTPCREPDYLRANSFLASTSQQVYTANLYKNLAGSAKKSIDIALVYDKKRNAVYFESPIKMRAHLWHNTFECENLFDYSFDLPCHTRYMPAPTDFTNDDFERITRQEDFSFAFSEAEAAFPVTTGTPCFVFVQTGNGLKGVIRINDLIPESTEVIGGITYPVNPAITMDLKFPRSFSEQKMR